MSRRDDGVGVTGVIPRVTALILARGGSKGVPGKNSRRLLGVELIKWPVLIVKQVAGVDSVWVSTDDAEIACSAKAAGASIHHRAAHTATDEATSLSGVLEFLQHHNQPADSLLLLLQCTSPLLVPADVQQALQLVQHQNWDSVFSVAKKIPCLCWKTTDAGLVPVNFDPSDRPRRQDLQPEYTESGHFYLTRTALVLQHHSLQTGRCWYVEIPSDRVCDIDTEQDFQKAEVIAKQLDLTPGTIKWTS